MRFGKDNYELQKSAQKSLLRPEQNSRHARIYAAIRKISEKGSIFHVLSDTPSQLEDIYSVLVDDEFVLGFELLRSDDDPAPIDVEIQSIAQFRQENGQRGSHTLEATLVAARKLLSQNQ